MGNHLRRDSVGSAQIYADSGAAPATYNGYVRQTALSSFAVANAARRLSV
jgi:hypothetical protein